MKIVSIDTGATWTRIWNGTSSVERFHTPASYEKYIELVTRVVGNHAPVDRLVVGLPGSIHHQVIAKLPNLNETWTGRMIDVDLRTLVADGGKIVVMQDTEAAGYAIQRAELEGYDPTLLISISTGVGGALVTAHDVKVLEIGHMPMNLSGANAECSCQQHGCVETDISGEHILRRTGIQPENLDDKKFWSMYGEELGQWMLNLICVFKLRQILLIGGVTHQHGRFLPTAQEFIRERLRLVPMPRIALSRLNGEAGVQGGYWVATAL